MEQKRAAFYEAIAEAIRECNEFGYHPTKWQAMNSELGPIEAAKKLVLSGDFQDGFKRLLKEGRENLTVEAIVSRSEFAELFSRDILTTAQWRLVEGKRRLAEGRKGW
ncbi:hypothetical protein ACF8QE_04280 [Pseudomonas sp. GLN_3]|uniref:hypothetical protein n=1 Tax=Pseudomonas sp. GLN_3 TaxID=3367181 RepID=UPI00370BE3DF